MELRGWLEFQTGDISCERLGRDLYENKKHGEGIATHTSGDVSLGNQPHKAWMPGGFHLARMGSQKETPICALVWSLKVIPIRDLYIFQPVKGGGLKKDI